MPVEIPLTRGYVALVDEADAEWLMQYSWHISPPYRGGSTLFYANRAGDPGEPSTVRMHRMITGCPGGYIVDHFDNNGLNNQRSNLRILTHSANRARVPESKNKHCFPGVLQTGDGGWYGRVQKDGAAFYTKHCDGPAEAHDARNQLLLKLYGEHVLLNAPAAQAPLQPKPSVRAVLHAQREAEARYGNRPYIAQEELLEFVSNPAKRPIYGRDVRRVWIAATRRSWGGMIARVDGRSGRKAYYDRGIDIDPRWRDFWVFLADMGVKGPGLSIDRIDNDRGYWPENCRWATCKQQNANKRMHGKRGLKQTPLYARYGLSSKSAVADFADCDVPISVLFEKGVRVCEATNELVWDRTRPSLKRRETAAEAAEVLRLREQGLTFAAIADDLGRSLTFVWKIAKRSEGGRNAP